MEKSTLNILMSAITFFLGAMTLIGLGDAAAHIDKFYWVPFAVNLGLYAYLVIRFVKKSKESEE